MFSYAKGDCAMKMLKKLISEDRGQGLVEYSLILAFIAIVIVVLGPFIRSAIEKIWQGVIDVLTAS